MNTKWNMTGMLAAALIVGLSTAYGKERAAVEKKEGAPIVVTGDNVCLGCSLKTEQGAAAQCSVYGHTHALRVEKATVDGKAAPELKGKVLHYLPTSISEKLIKEHHGEKLTLTGKVYTDAQVLEVSSVGTDTEHPKKAEHPKTEHPKKADHPKSEHPDHPK